MGELKKNVLRNSFNIVILVILDCQIYFVEDEKGMNYFFETLTVSSKNGENNYYLCQKILKIDIQIRCNLSNENISGIPCIPKSRFYYIFYFSYVSWNFIFQHNCTINFLDANSEKITSLCPSFNYHILNKSNSRSFIHF